MVWAQLPESPTGRDHLGLRNLSPRSLFVDQVNILQNVGLTVT